MANHKSAEKRARQDVKRNAINRQNRGQLRTEIKKLRGAILEGNREQAQALLPEAISAIDKSIQKGVLHKNAAARHKSRLTTAVGKMSA